MSGYVGSRLRKLSNSQKVLLVVGGFCVVALASYAVAPNPTPPWTHSGDPQCAITYQAGDDTYTLWGVTTTVPGELVTHMTDSGGNVYSHNGQAQPGAGNFTAPVPLDSVTHLDGVLTDSGGRTYNCSVAPAQ